MNLSNEARQNAIDLSDAANRALTSGNHGLAEKLTKEAEKLIGGGGPTFEEWAGERNYNVEKHDGLYVSKHTTELSECWQAAQAQ